MNIELNEDEIEPSGFDIILPSNIYEIRFHGTIKELIKYLPELYEKIRIREKK